MLRRFLPFDWAVCFLGSGLGMILTGLFEIFVSDLFDLIPTMLLFLKGNRLGDVFRSGSNVKPVLPSLPFSEFPHSLLQYVLVVLFLIFLYLPVGFLILNQIVVLGSRNMRLLFR